MIVSCWLCFVGQYLVRLWLFQKYLGDKYSIHTVPKQYCAQVNTISPHMFGWPMYRSRLYLVGTLNKTCHLPQGLNAMTGLFRKPMLDCASLLTAPAAEVDETRIVAARKQTVASTSTFKESLAGGKRQRSLSKYDRIDFMCFSFCCVCLF